MTRRKIYPAGGLPEETIPVGKKPDRNWEKKNKAHSYWIPAPLHNLARRAREDVNSIAHYDENSQPRNDQTTADQIAGILVDVALQKIAVQPDLITATTNARGRGKMTVYAQAWDVWQKPPPIQQLPKPPDRKKKPKARPVFVGYRWPAETDQSIRDIAGKHEIPAGEAVLRLLQIGIDAYKQREFRIVVEVQATVRAVGWE